MDFPPSDMQHPIPCSRRGGWLIRSVLFVAAFGLIVSAAWIVLLPGITVSTIRARTGFVMKVERLSVNPFTGRVHIEGAVVENPLGWPTHEFITLRRFKVEADLLPLLSHKFVADEVIIDVEKLSLVRNHDGLLNADEFRNGWAKGNGGTAKPDQPKTDSPKNEFLIHHLVLKFDHLTMADYSGQKALVKDYDLKISREMREVDSVAKLASPFVGSMLTAQGGLADMGVGILGAPLSSLQQAGKKTGDSLKKLFQSLEKKKP
jgi:hypothetical protein